MAQPKISLFTIKEEPSAWTIAIILAQSRANLIVHGFDQY
jgi:hypothetical protein